MKLEKVTSWGKAGSAAIDEQQIYDMIVGKEKKKNVGKKNFYGRRYFDVSLLVALIPCKIR